MEISEELAASHVGCREERPGRSAGLWQLRVLVAVALGWAGGPAGRLCVSEAGRDRQGMNQELSFHTWETVKR